LCRPLAGVAPGPQDSKPVDPELDSLVTSLERGWLQSASFPEPVFVGIDLASGPDICAKYDATSASFAASDSASNNISKSAKASI
jgi:hypothetical protein